MNKKSEKEIKKRTPLSKKQLDEITGGLMKPRVSKKKICPICGAKVTYIGIMPSWSDEHDPGCKYHINQRRK